MPEILTISSSYPRFEGDVIAPFIEHITEKIISAGNKIDMILPYHPQFKQNGGKDLKFHLCRYTNSDNKNIWGYAGSMKADVTLKKQAFLLAPRVYRNTLKVGEDLLGSGKFDLIHAHWLLPNGLFAMRLASRSKLPLVVSLHGSDVTIGERPLFRPLAKRIFKKAAWVSACSDDLRIRAIKLGCAPEKIITIPYGVDTLTFKPDTRRMIKLRNELGKRFKKGDVIILAVGRLVEKKGFTYLLDAMAKIKRKSKKALLVIVGEGDLEEQLKAKAKELKISKRVIFTGKVERNELPIYFSGCDILAVPSVRDRLGNLDGLPNVLMEGLASGRAIVASEIAGIPSVIENGRNGILVQPENAKGLAKALLSLVENKEIRNQMGAEARRDAVNHYTWKHSGGQYADGLVSILKGKI